MAEIPKIETGWNMTAQDFGSHVEVRVALKPTAQPVDEMIVIAYDQSGVVIDSLGISRLRPGEPERTANLITAGQTPARVVVRASNPTRQRTAQLR